MKNILNILTKEAGSLAKSTLRSHLKGGINNIINVFKSKSQEQIEQEIFNDIGYLTSLYSISKDQKISYKSGPVFMHEFITNSPDLKDRITKDDENGMLFFDGKEITGKDKLDIVHLFQEKTKVKSVAVVSHFNQALQLLEAQSLMSSKFKNHFSGWDPNSPSIIDQYLTKCFGTFDTDPAYANLLWKKWIVGTAQRAINPGSSLDGCLTLKGPAGKYKTRFFRGLLPVPFQGRTTEVYTNIKKPEKFVETTIGKTIVCFDELSSVLEYPKVEETFKQLLSSQEITVRLPWRKDAGRFPLRAGFCATTNKDKFITNEFMSRRLWVIALNDQSNINTDYYFDNQHKLWQEAVYLATQNYKTYLSPQEQIMVEENNKPYLI